MKQNCSERCDWPMCDCNDCILKNPSKNKMSNTDNKIDLEEIAKRHPNYSWFDGHERRIILQLMQAALEANTKTPVSYPRWVRASKELFSAPDWRRKAICRMVETKYLICLDEFNISFDGLRNAVGYTIPYSDIEMLDENPDTVEVNSGAVFFKELEDKFSHCFLGQNTSFKELVDFIKTAKGTIKTLKPVMSNDNGKG